jgi:hypothetical protein
MKPGTGGMLRVGFGLWLVMTTDRKRSFRQIILEREHDSDLCWIEGLPGLTYAVRCPGLRLKSLDMVLSNVTTDGEALCHQASDVMNMYASCVKVELDDGTHKYIRRNITLYTGKGDIKKVRHLASLIPLVC